MNRHILDTLNKKEEEQYSHLVERKKARAQMKRYRNTGDICEFFRKENENAEGQNRFKVKRMARGNR